MDKPESIKYSWKWLTADAQLSTGACELVYAFLSADGQTTGKAVIYDGENVNGDMILTFEAIANSGTPFAPGVPVYCRRGLYVDYAAGAGIFLLWREIGR